MAKYFGRNIQKKFKTSKTSTSKLHPYPLFPIFLKNLSYVFCSSSSCASARTCSSDFDRCCWSCARSSLASK